ncbi:MAG TPA: AAA family ATPase [Aggregatilineales bacterium]|nr:AAA family ATPase [Aggregatilineales bacterium]
MTALAATNNLISIADIRYRRLEKIGEGGMGTVYRVYDRLSNKVLALKTVSTAGEQHWMHSRFSTSDRTDSQTSLRLALAHEFQTLASLRHPNIVSVTDYGFNTDKNAYFTMEILDGGEDIVTAAGKIPLAGRVSLLIQMFEALAYVHRRGLLHRDLKPANVLVFEGVVKVIDFGLSVMGDAESGTSGTLYYMPPEMLSGLRASAASDLYAAGVIGYEMLTGHHPFPTESLSTFMVAALSELPDLREIDPALQDIIAVLLSKMPADRPASASEVIHALRVAFPDTAAGIAESIRESYLQSAPFVGRAEEQNKLFTAMEELLGGRGSAWLIGGESGVGKSRLLDQVRVRALIAGALVLRGQAASGGRMPYQTWRDTLRWLALLTDPKTLEASILKPLVPDIDMLLERQIPPPPPLSPIAAKARLIATITDIVSRQPYPIVLIVEDVQWAGAQSLDLLNAFVRLSASHPLLVLGNYRDDEAPQLAVQLAAMHHLKLGRLLPAQITALSRAMIGEVEQMDHVLELLQRETEGNVFFLVEVVRALALEAGDLSKIGERTLPAHVFTGGVNKLLERRLAALPLESRHLLRLAAVAGRALDLDVLRVMSDPKWLDHWLTLCQDAAVLEYHEGAWRFAHDKLRESILREMDVDQLSALHRRIAEAMQKRYGADTAHASSLAYHWGEAGDLPKEGYYAGLAGEYALQNGAYQESVVFLEKALNQDVTLTPDPEQRKHLPRAERERALGQAYYGLGNLGKAREHGSQALLYLGRKLPEGRGGVSALIRAFARQSAHRIGVIPKVLGEVRPIHEAVRVYGLIGEISYFTAEPLLGVYCVLGMTNLAESIPPTPELARAYVNMGIAMQLIGFPKRARRYVERALEVGTGLSEKAMYAQVLNLAGVWHVGMGEWAEAQTYFEKGRDLAHEIGDRREWITSYTTLGVMCHYQGRYHDSMLLNSTAYEHATQLGNKQGWGMYTKAESEYRWGRFAEALKSYEKSMEYVVGDIRRSSEARVAGGRAICYMGLGDYDSAIREVEQMRSLLGKTSPTVYSMLDAYSSWGDVYLRLAERAEKAGETPSPAHLEQAAAGCKLLKRFGKIYPVGRARARLWAGRYERLVGKRDTALSEMLEAAADGKALAMPYEEALARYYAGVFGSPDTRQQLQTAQAIFERLDAQADVAKCAAVLGA